MILYSVTVYNAILIISYYIITYKLIYITVPEEHPEAYSMGWPPAQGSSVGLGLKEAKERPCCGWRGPSQLQAGELLGRHSERDRGQALSSLCALKTLTDLMRRCRDGEGRVAESLSRAGLGQNWPAAPGSGHAVAPPWSFLHGGSLGSP